MSTENPFNKTPVSPPESSPDTSWIDMAEGSAEAVKQNESAPSEDSLKAAEEKFGVPVEPAAPTAEDAAALAAINERLGIKKAESSTSELADVSEAELQAMSPEQLLEFTKQVHVENQSLERENTTAWNTLLENIRGPIKEQLEARLAQGNFSDYREESTLKSVISDMDNSFNFSSDIRAQWKDALIDSQVNILPFLSDDVKDQIAAFYAQEQAMSEKKKPILEKAAVANQLLREQQSKAA